MTRLRSFLNRRSTAIGAAYVVLGFVIVLILIAGTGGDVGLALSGWFEGAFGNGFNLVQTLAYATPLTLVAVGVGVALRANVVTVGAEGQMVVGAIFSTVAAFAVGPHVPLLVGLVIGALAGALGGALWSLLPALARVRWGVNEILFTLLANYIASYLLTFLLRTALRDPGKVVASQSKLLPDSFDIPLLPVQGQLHWGTALVLVLVVAAVIWNRSRGAFLIEVYGQRPILAARLGLTPTRAVVSTMLVSGVTAGLAGWMQLAGVAGRLGPGVSAGIGFAGLAVAVLGRGNPIGILIAAILYSSLTTGANGVQVATGTTPASIGTVTQGVLLLAAGLALASGRFRQTLLSRRSRAASGDDEDPRPAAAAVTREVEATP
ncbi:ABC transporter permease [Galbitalea soli]|uniref:ABC transporter permease n=1 Tax=Galbitalea soli TaxID=1268042 RepID=A0A7C9TRH8_9MICO|nr:ABC transporter permease [Galbitalea soli]NEM91500.1 ABC transporter permease [Galbitalea soli]NYJ30193.1 simple sugar transport system permease protein [Galbitalea soli]